MVRLKGLSVRRGLGGEFGSFAKSNTLGAARCHHISLLVNFGLCGGDGLLCPDMGDCVLAYCPSHGFARLCRPEPSLPVHSARLQRAVWRATIEYSSSPPRRIPAVAGAEPPEVHT
jgi:hypothetical protein